MRFACAIVSTPSILTVSGPLCQISVFEASLAGPPGRLTRCGRPVIHTPGAWRSCDLDELSARPSCGELLADLRSEPGCGDLSHEQPYTLRCPVQKRDDVAAAIDAVGRAEKLGVEQAERRLCRRDRLAQIERSSGLHLRQALDERDVHGSDMEEAEDRCPCVGHG